LSPVVELPREEMGALLTPQTGFLFFSFLFGCEPVCGSSSVPLLGGRFLTVWTSFFWRSGYSCSYRFLFYLLIAPFLSASLGGLVGLGRTTLQGVF